VHRVAAALTGFLDTSAFRVVLWAALPPACYYVIRPRVNSAWLRAALAGSGCATLLATTFSSSRTGSMNQMLPCLMCWTVSLRLVQLTSLPATGSAALSPWQFLSRVMWFLLPVSVRKRPKRTLPQVALHAAKHLSLAALELTALRWINKWLFRCLEAYPPPTSMGYLSSLKFSGLYLLSFFFSMYALDIFAALVPLLSLDRFEFLEVNDWPILSSSLRDFWGRRYNRLVSALLRESVFMPLHSQAGFPTWAAALAAFGISGLMHAHWVLVGFGSWSDAMRVLGFFLLHGVGCSVEKLLPSALQALMPSLLLAVTAPLFAGTFIRAGPAFLRQLDPAIPPLIDLPVPGPC
jgi:hypothetical protein